MRILVCNDDGHLAPGLAALERAARTLSDDVWVVAPSRKLSSMGHQISLHAPFTLTQTDARHFVCSGTPADCAIAALGWLFKDAPAPDLVLSGVNDGRNIGEDIAYSGTMAIAREASFWGIPAVAFSAAKEIDFSHAEVTAWLGSIVQGLGRDIAAWHRPDHWLSINLPATPGPLRAAVPGRAKIAPAVLSEALLSDGVHGAVTQLRYTSGRRTQRRPDDELSRLDAGAGTVYRLCWNSVDPVGDALLDRLNTAAHHPA